MGIRVTDPDLLRRLNRRDDEEEERERFDLTPSAPVVPGGKRVTDPDLLNLLNKKREPVAPDASLAPMGDQILGDPMSYYGGEAGGNIGSGGLGAMVGKMAEGVTRGGAAMTRGVSDVVDYLGRKAPGASGLALDTGLMLEDRQTRMAPGTFLPQQVNQAIDKGIDIWVESADYWKDYAEKHGAGPVDEIFGQATGGAIPGIGEFIMGPFYAAAKEAAAAEKRGDSELAAMIKGGIKRYLMGRILHSTGELNLPLRTGALGTVGAVEGYAETGDVGEAVKGGMILGGMGLVPFGERPRLGGMGTRDVLSRWAEPGRGIPEPSPTPQFQSPERQRIWEIETIARRRMEESDPRLVQIYPRLEDWIADDTTLNEYVDLKSRFGESIVTGEVAKVTPGGLQFGQEAAIPQVQPQPQAPEVVTPPPATEPPSGRTELFPEEAEIPAPKVKKGKKEPVSGGRWKGKLYISAVEAQDIKMWQEGVAPFFTTQKGKGTNAQKVIQEMIDRGDLREGATLDDLVDWIKSRKGGGAAATMRREAGTVRGEEAIAEAGEEYLARQAEEEAALDEEIAQERPITEISQIPMYRGEAGDEKVGAFGNTKLALPTFTDNPTAAGSYATEMGVKTNKPYYVRKSTLAVNNPIDLRVGHEGEDVVSVQSLQRHGFTPDEIFTIVKGSTGWRSSESLERGEVDLSAEEVSRRVQAGEEVYTNQYHVADSKEFVELTRGKGYDGSVINGTFHPFDSEQAESLRDNNDYVMEVRPYSAEQIKDYGVPEQPKAPTPTGRFIVQGMQVIDTTTGNVAKTGRDPAALQKVADALNAKAAPPAPTAPKAPKAAPMPEGTPSWVPYQTTRGGAIYKTPEGSYVLVNEGSDAFQDYDGEKVAAFYVRPTKTTGKITYKRYKGIKFGTLEEVNAQLAERAKKMGWELVTESNPPTDYDRIDQFTREAYQRIRANPQLAEYEVRQLVKQELEKETGFWEGSRTVDSYYINALEGIAPTTREEIFAKEPAAEKEPSLPGVKEQEQFRLTAPERPAGAPEGEFETPAGGEQETLPGMKPRIEDMKKKRPEAQGEGPLFDVIEEIGRGVPGKEEKQPGLSIRAVAMATDVTPTGEKYEFGGSVNPEVNQRWADSDKGLAGDVTFWQRAKSWATRVKNEFTRAHVLLEKRRFAVPLEILRWYDATVGVSKKSAVNMVYGIVGRLGPEKSKLFTRLLILPDLIRDVDRGLYRWPEIEGKKYPWGYESVDEMRVDLARFEQEARNLPDVQEALAYRSRMVKQLVKELVANDLLSEEALTNPDYYHHQVLERMRAEDADLWKGGPFSGVSSRDVRPHTKGFQIGRKGSVKDYNTRYIEAEYEWFAQAISQLRTKYALDRLDAAENVYGKVIAEAQRRWGDTRDPEDNRLLWRKRWKELIDEMYPGYKVWQPKPGNWFWRGRTITERTLDQILVDGIKEIVVRGEDYMILDTRTGEMKPLGDSLILGGRNQEWVIPKELADTLNTYREFGEQSFLERGSRAMLQGWKQYILFNPVRALKYLTNNTTGDLDVTFAYDPAILKYVNRKDIGDLYNYFVRRRGPTKDILEAESHDVVGGITIAEIAEIGRESVFRDIVSPRPMRAIRYFEFVRDFNAFRESILRMAAYKYFKDRLSKGEVHYGASDAGQIRKLMQQPMEGLWDKDMMIKTVAAKLSRELVGDYGNISAGGRWLRQHMIPFYSWLEINAPRYYRMMKNAATEGGPATFGETFARKGAGSLARFFVQALTLYGAVNVWNYMMFPEENRKLNGQKGQLHLILHKDRETGKVTSIRFQGALSDALGWFGLESVGTDIQGLREGDLSPQEKLTEMAKAPAEKLWMGIRPEKTVAETIVGRTTYPNLFSRSSWRPGSGARPIRDPGEALSRLVSMDVPYRYARGLPTRGVGHDLTSLLLYRSDPGERAYQNIRNEAMDFLEQRGRTKPSTTYTPKTLALYYYKQAIQMGDSRAEERWLNKYISEGGTAEAMERSVKAGTPENWIPKDLRDEFIYSLTPRQLQDFGEAIEWWERVYGY